MKQCDIYKMIEDKVVSQLENGIIPWKRCYHVGSGGLCVSHQSGKPYSLINQFLLGTPGEYWSFEQIKKERLSLRKGCKAEKVVFWTVYTPKDLRTFEDEKTSFSIPFLKYYNVFHESDVIGLPAKEVSNDVGVCKDSDCVDTADSIVNGYLERNKELKVLKADRVPCFCPTDNTISIPEKCQFDSLNGYYATLFHEIIHSTGVPLKREMNGFRQSKNGYAREELVAEIGSAYLLNKAGIYDEDLNTNCAAYCKNWLSHLKDDIKMLVWAASRAESASKYVLCVKEDESEE